MARRRRCHHELGRPAKVTPHQFRTRATRLINNDVSQEVVRRLLDHTSHTMTARYARLTDSTIRTQWERARKIDIHGQTVDTSSDSLLGDAEWMNHNLARAKMAHRTGIADFRCRSHVHTPTRV